MAEVYDVLTCWKQVRQWGLTYIHTRRPTSTRRAIFHERRISSVTFVVRLSLGNSTSRWLADSSAFGLLGINVPQNGRFPAHSFQECFLVPLLLSSKVKSSFSLNLDSPLHTLKTSMRSCLFLLSSSVHSLKQCNLSSYDFPYIFLIIFVNLLWTFSISCLSFI